MEGREILKKEGDHSSLFDVRFNKQGDLQKFSWEASKIGKSPHSPIRRVKVYIIAALIRFSHIHPLDGFNNTLLYQGHSFYH